MKISLPKKIEEFDKVIYSPFCIFEKKNFLEESVYQMLKKSFPNEAVFQGSHKNGNKIFLNNKHDAFFKFIKDNIWGDFYNYFNQKSSIDSLLELIKSELNKIENRKNFKNYFLNKEYSQNIFRKVLIKFLKQINLSSLRLGFEFSIIKKNCFIPPHCDTENKLLSLMIYFPPKKKIDSSEDYLDLGTNFYDKRSNAKKNLDIWQSKYLDKEGSKTFYDNYKVFYKSKFEENKLVGFIKNDKSWHDVSVFNQDLLRKSLNINLYIE